MTEGPRIYNLFPLLCGTMRQWEDHLPRIAAMGFNWIYVNPFQYPGFSGSLYAIKDYYRIHDRMRDGEQTLEASLKSFCRKAGELGLSVMMDLVINHTSKDSLLAKEHPEWFLHDAKGGLHSPRAIDPADANKVTVWGDLAEIDYSISANRTALTRYWETMIDHFLDCDIRGFRCDAAYQVPPDVWEPLIASARRKRPEAKFFAETLGCRLEQVQALDPVGFDHLFNSSKWWDFEAPWLLEQYNSFRHIAPSVAFPESHDTERLFVELDRTMGHDLARIERAYRRSYMFAAIFSTGVMMPVGFEYGFRTKLNVVTTHERNWDIPSFDLTGFIAEINRMKASVPAFNIEGPQQRLKLGDSHVVCLLRQIENAEGWAMSFINTGERKRRVKLDHLDLEWRTKLLDAREVTPGRERLTLQETLRMGEGLTLKPDEVRIFINQ